MKHIKIVGHRGARNEAPENTVESFQHATNNGCLDFELDIQLSSDKELLVYHDKSLKRTSGINKKLSALPYSYLKEIDARDNTPGWPEPCRIANLETVVDAIPNTQSWQFEVKTDRRTTLSILADKLITLIKEKALLERCHVTSGNKWFLSLIKKKEPKIKTGFVCEFLYQRPISTCLNTGSDLLVLNHKLASRSLVEKAHKKDLNISCWTVNDLARVDYLLDLGVNNIITDIPTTMIKHYFR
ncbi:MAG: glycerophosphodiester phosphodiesterase [Oleiphilus sp.]